MPVSPEAKAPSWYRVTLKVAEGGRALESDKPGFPFGIYCPCEWTQPVSALGALLPASLEWGATTSAPTATVTAQRGGRDACQVKAVAGVQ